MSRLYESAQGLRRDNCLSEITNNSVLKARTLANLGVTGGGGGSGDALKSDPLSQFAATTSAQLAGVISDETGTGLLVFGTSPTLITPALGTPTALTLTNATGLPAAGIGSGTIAQARLGTGSDGSGTHFLADDQTYKMISGGGDALTSVGLQQFAATTSLQLKGVISDETGSGALVFATSPTFVTPALGTPASGVATNLSGTASSLTSGSVITNANTTGDVTSVGNTTTIAASAVTLAKMANMATASLIYRKTAGTGAPEVNSLATLKTDLGLTGTNSGDGVGAVTGAFDGGGVALTVGNTGIPWTAPYAGTITGWSISVDAGTATFTVWKKATGTAIPTIADLINTSGVAISTGTHIRSSTVSDFTTTTVTAGDQFIIALTAVATATKAVLEVEITR